MDILDNATLRRGRLLGIIWRADFNLYKSIAQLNSGTPIIGFVRGSRNSRGFAGKVERFVRRSSMVAENDQDTESEQIEV